MNNSNGAPEMNPRRPMRLACVHRGVGPENGIAFLIYRGRKIPLEITKLRNVNRGREFSSLRYVSSRRTSNRFANILKSELIEVIDSAKS